MFSSYDLNGFDVYINQSIQLLRIQNKFNVADHYQEYLLKYLQPPSSEQHKISEDSNPHSN